MSSTALIINMVSRWLNYLIAIPMIILGIIGAILTIITFTRKKSFLLSPTINYLLSASILTAIHLPTVYLQGILVDGFGLGIFNTNDLVCREYRYLFYMTTVSTISFPCWAAFDQYASTSRQVYFRNRWSSIRVARLAIIGTILFWGIIYMPMLFISRSVNGVCILDESHYTKFNDFFLTPLAYAVVPFVLIILFTQGTIRNLQTSSIIQRHDHLTQQVRRMLVPQLFILSISGIPFGLQNIYLNLTSNIPKDALRRSIEYLFIQIIRLFYHLNFVSTFYIYLYMSKEVRKTFKQFLYKYLKRNEIIPNDILLVNSTNPK